MKMFKPIKYTVKNGVTYFHYRYSDLKEFILLSRMPNRNGSILIRRKGNQYTYKIFGFYPPIGISEYDELKLDFETKTDDEIIEKEKPTTSIGSMKFYGMDFTAKE
jgi:hypothetical protein